MFSPVLYINGYCTWRFKFPFSFPPILLSVWMLPQKMLHSDLTESSGAFFPLAPSLLGCVFPILAKASSVAALEESRPQIEVRKRKPKAASASLSPDLAHGLCMEEKSHNFIASSKSEIPRHTTNTNSCPSSPQLWGAAPVSKLHILLRNTQQFTIRLQSE